MDNWGWLHAQLDLCECNRLFSTVISNITIQSPRETIMIRKAIILGLVFASAVLSAAKQKKFAGAITGVVSTEDGRAATNFRVCTLEHRKYGGMEQTQTCCVSTTNS